MNYKLDLFDQNWIDTVFEGRNKDYGAYDSRQKKSKTIIIAFILGSICFSFLVSIPVISNHLFKGNQEVSEILDEQITIVDLLPPPEEKPVDKFIPPPPPVKEIKSLKEIKKFTPPVVAPEEEVVEEIVSQEELKRADAGSRNVEASEEGEIVIDEKPVEQPKVVEQEITENQVVSFHAVEVRPEPKGGMKAFYQFISDNFRVPEVGHNFRAKIFVGFVVEKDGSLTDIKIIRDAGYGTGDEAVRVLQKAPKWKPGIQNGKPVRVAYQLPIVVEIM